MAPTSRRWQPPLAPTGPHPALIALAAGRPLPAITDDEVEALIASAVDHRMTGLLWTRVERGELTFPKPATVALARADLRTRAHHLRLWKTATALRDRLDASGIKVALAKGVAAEARWHDRLGERPSTDVDLLLEPGAERHLPKLFDALGPHKLLHADAARLLASGILQSIDLDVDGVEIDLHADILKFEIPTRQRDLMWQRICKVSGPHGATLDALDAELSFVHFLLHLNKDRFALLRGYTDVARILQREHLDWQFIDEFVQREGIGAIIYSTLRAVVSTLGLPYPPLPMPRGVRAWLWRRLWPPRLRLQGETGHQMAVRRQLYLPLLARGRFVEAVGWWIRRRLLPPAALVELYYPDTRGPYLSRLVRGRLRSWHKARNHHVG